MRRACPPLALAFAGLFAGLLAAAAPAAAGGPRASDFEAGVALPAGARAAAAVITTRPLRAPRRFDLIGFRWRSPGRVTLLVRVRREGGRWSRWVPASGADAGPGHGDPVWAGGADRYQLRLSRPVRALRAHFVRITGRARLSPRPQARAAAATPPPIIPRARWDPGNQCPPRAAPSYGRVDLAFVHHTVTANAYRPADAAAIVLAICRYHRNSNGWNDIGYNFLVDRYGQVFEGRAGGTWLPVVGAQAQGYNAVSTGISNIGEFSTTPQTSAGLRALGQLIGWRLAIAGVPTRGTATEVSGGGPLNRFAYGVPVTLQRISGHRDGDATECPGGALYAQLPQIRTLAAAAARGVRPQATVTLQSTRLRLSFGQRVTLSGRLVRPDQATGASEPIELQRAVRGRPFATVATTQAAADGRWTLTLAPRANGRIRARWAGDRLDAATASPALALVVRRRLTLRARAVRVATGRSARIAGTVAPRAARVEIRVYRRVRRGVYARVERFRVRARRGRFAFSDRLARTGLYRFQAHVPADAANGAGWSRYLFVRAR